MALSLVGSELWPPLLVTSSLKLRKTFSAACMGVDAELRVDEVAVLFDEPIGAVGGAAFLIGGEGEDEIARGLEVFALHTQEGGDEGGVVALHVGSSASVEVAV